MKRLLFITAIILHLPQTVEAGFEDLRIAPQIAQPGEQVSLVIEMTFPDILPIEGFPNIVSERVITRQIVGGQIDLTLASRGTVGGLDQGDVVIPIGRFIESGNYVVNVLIVSDGTLGSGGTFTETLGFNVVNASVPTLSLGPLLVLILCVLLVGAMAWRKHFS